ncbi:KEOPS complex subunit Pcc1 [Halopenitus sp. H-Gu1]|uniref:KEOPS complex subunit Pcc1 n=1 Tax=Halopenitus sp. H-Gu1 TaxID=3242697 RepID=UPI00359CF3CB
MTDPSSTDEPTDRPQRTAVVRTRHDDPALVNAALVPDDTDSMDGEVDDGVIVRRIARGTTGGLQSTVDDYLRNLHVADRVVDRGRDHVESGRTMDARRSDADETDEGHADETDEETAVENGHRDEHDTT